MKKQKKPSKKPDLLDQIDIIDNANEIFKGSESLTGEAYDILIKVLERNSKNTSNVKGML